MSNNLPAKAPKTKAVAYIRVSTDKQELSPEAQRDVITRWAQLNEIKIVSFHEDTCSGSTPWMERQGLTEAVNNLKRAQASWLVIAKMDRLSRDLYNQLHLQKELARFDARAIAATESPEDELTPEKQLMQNMLGSFAEFERAMIRGRIKAALAVRKAQGIRLGAIPLEETELGRCIIWAIWSLKDRGHGAKTIAKLLNEREVVGPRGGKQHERNIAKILQSARPTEVPQAWRGMDMTFKRFSAVSRQAESTRKDPNDPRGRPVGRTTAQIAKDAAAQLRWSRK